MNRIPWKSLLPAFAAIALFYTLSLVYFSPMLEGKRLAMGDIKQWQGMAREVEEHRERTGEEALWTGSMFSGMPAYQISVKWASNLLQGAHQLFSGFLPRPASFLFLYLVGMYVLLRILKIDPWLSLVGAIAFAFSTYFLILLPTGHTSKANAIGYMPLVLGGVWLLYRGRMLLGAALLALFLGLEITMNHVQVTYYLAMLLVLFALAELVRAVREKQVGDFAKRSGLGLLAVIFALLCNIGSLWSTWEYGRFSTRGASELTIRSDGSSAADIRTTGLDRDYVTDYSFSVQETFNMLVPDAKGGHSSAIGTDPEVIGKSDPRFRQNVSQMSRYWGDQRFVAGPMYVGAIALLFMVLMLAQAEGRARWWVIAAVPVLVLLLRISSPEVAFALLAAYLIAGIFLWSDGLSVALVGAMLLAIVLSWGRNYMPLTDFFLDYIPGYNKFRAVTIILVVVALAVPLLGIRFVDRLVKSGGWDKSTEKRSLIGMGLVLGLLLIMGLAPALLFDFVSEQERDAFTQQMDAAPQQEAQYLQFIDSLKAVRIGLFTADAWRSFAFVLGASVLLVLFGRRKIAAPWLIAGLGLLVLADQYTVAKRYVNNEKDRGRYTMWEEAAASEIPHRPNAADLAILEQETTPALEADMKAAMDRIRSTKKRVLPEEEMQLRFASMRRTSHNRTLLLGNPFNDARTSYFHKSLGGYHGAKLKRYQELIEFQLAPAIGRVSAMLQTGTSMEQMDSLLAKEGVLNMLNARYLIYNPERPPITNLNAFGPAWFVDELRWAKNADDEITALDEVDLARTAVIDERFRSMFPTPPVADPSASVELSSYETNNLKYVVRSSSGGVVVFSEIWYGPDWKAYIDGQPVEYARANYVLRALSVPAGEHTVEFRVESRAFNASAPIALASSGLLILLVLLLLGMEVKRMIETGEETA
jgi:hypothetical protein